MYYFARLNENDKVIAMGEQEEKPVGNEYVILPFTKRPTREEYKKYAGKYYNRETGEFEEVNK